MIEATTRFPKAYSRILGSIVGVSVRMEHCRRFNVASCLALVLLAALQFFGQGPSPQTYVLSFPRTSAAISPVAPQLNVGAAFTMETWIYQSEPRIPWGPTNIMGKLSSAEKSYVIEFDPAGRFRFNMTAGGVGRSVVYSTLITQRRWTHVAVTHGGGTMSLFVDGVLVGTNTSPGTPGGADTPFSVGGAFPGGNWCCTVSNVYLRQMRVWNRVLSQSEIATNMPRRMAGNEAGLVAQWMMEDGLGQTIDDSGPNGIDLQLGNVNGYDVFDPRWVRTRVLDDLLYFQWETYPSVAYQGSIQGDLLDIDGDGDLDWFDFRSHWPDGTDTARVYRNNGTGVFTDVTAMLLPQEVRTYGTCYEFKDFNGDGRIDVFFNDVGPDTTPFPGGPVRILIQSPTGTFLDETAGRLPAMTRLSAATSSADIDGDGDIDILMTTRRPPGPELLINDGTGHFTIEQSRLPAWLTSLQRKMMSGVFLNVNGDNRPDLYFGESENFTTRDAILINNGSGTFVDAPVTTLPPRLYGTDGYVNAARAGDFNNDGRSDILASVETVGNFFPNRFQIYLSNGDGTYRDGSSGVPQPLNAGPDDDIYYPYITDFNRDGKMDFITSAFTRYVQIYLNLGGGRFTIATDIYPASQDVQFPVPGDIDRDGDIDIVSPLNGSFEVLRNQNPFRVGSPPNDFDGDGKTDVSIFRPSNGQWWLSRSTAGVIAHTFGNSSDLIAPGDFTGDGKTDVTVFRPSDGSWYVLRSEDSTFYSFPFGTGGDRPVPGDYDADGKADAAVFRPSNSTWYIQKSSGGTTIQGFGVTGDFPVPADYDGDGKTDIAIYRPSNGQWWLNRSTAGLIVHTFGNSGDKNVQGDYTGDGKADIAIWRPSDGNWYILRSENATFYSFPFGTNGDLPVPGDFDGDGKFDAGVFRPSAATWYVQRSTAGTMTQSFGAATDLPVPNSTVR